MKQYHIKIRYARNFIPGGSCFRTGRRGKLVYVDLCILFCRGRGEYIDNIIIEVYVGFLEKA